MSGTPEQLPLTSDNPALATGQFWHTDIELSAYLGKEHFEDFRLVSDQPFSKQLVGHVFNNCVQDQGHRFTVEKTQYGNRITGFASYTPREGLIVTERSNIDMEPYHPSGKVGLPNLSSICNDYVIQAGSLINIMPTLNPEQQRTDAFLQALGSRLLFLTEIY